MEKWPLKRSERSWLFAVFRRNFGVSEAASTEAAERGTRHGSAAAEKARKAEEADGDREETVAISVRQQ